MKKGETRHPDAEEIQVVPVAEFITLGALGVALYGDRWLSQMAGSMGIAKGHLARVLNGEQAITSAFRARVARWAVDACMNDIEAALSRVRLFRAVEAAWGQPKA